MAVVLTALPLGAWLGTALQLQQRVLDGAWVYGAALAAALALALGAAWRAHAAGGGRWLWLPWLAAGALAAWARRAGAPRPWPGRRWRPSWKGATWC